MVSYRCGAVTENDDVGLAIWQTDELINRICSEVSSDKYRVYISGDNNFRYEIYPDYKAHRRDKPKPRHLEAIREHLLVNHPSNISDGMEADDELAIECTRLGQEGTPCIVASLDKDLLQVVGTHYNFVRREFREIGELEGQRNFYLQLLIGDPADNIPGCTGIGKVKAPKLLDGATDPVALYRRCLEAYTKAGLSTEIMHRNAKLLYLKRREDDEWKPPTDGPSPEPQS